MRHRRKSKDSKLKLRNQSKFFSECFQATPASEELLCYLTPCLIKGIVIPSILIMFSSVPCVHLWPRGWSSLWMKLDFSHHKKLVWARKEPAVHIKLTLSPTGQATWLLWSLSMLFVSENVNRLGFMWYVGAWNWGEADIYNQKKNYNFKKKKQILHMSVVSIEKQMAANASFHFLLVDYLLSLPFFWSCDPALNVP